MEPPDTKTTHRAARPDFPAATSNSIARSASHDENVALTFSMMSRSSATGVLSCRDRHLKPTRQAPSAELSRPTRVPVNCYRRRKILDYPPMDRPLRPVMGIMLFLIFSACAQQPAPPPVSSNIAPPIDNTPPPKQSDSSNPPAMQPAPIIAATTPSQQSDPVSPVEPVVVSNPPPATNPAPAPKPTRAYLGIVPDPSARASSVGVLLQGVQPDSPAAAAELQAGDLIIEVDSRPVANLDQLGRILDLAPVGRKITLTILRGEARLQLTARLGPPPVAGHN